MALEQVENLVSGCFVLDAEQPRSAVEDSEEEDEDGDELQWLAYKDVAKVQQGRSFIEWDKPKLKTGVMIDLQTKRTMNVRGHFHVVGQWWQTSVLRTKVSRDKYREPKDIHALCYKLRVDGARLTDNVVQLFLSQVEAVYRGIDWFAECREKFACYLKRKNQYDDLDLGNLEVRLENFKQNFKGKISHMARPSQMNSPDEPEEQQGNGLQDFVTMITDTDLYKQVKLAQTHPELLRYLPQLFPFQFQRIICLPLEKLEPLAAAVNEEPGILAFKPIVARKCRILGCETSSDALKKSGLMENVPIHVQDAICIYEFMKKETKEAGHTGIFYNKILDVLGPVVEQFEEALAYLNTNKVTRTQMEGGYRVVYLMSLWKAENTIARCVSSLVEMNQQQPWKLKVQWDSDDFSSIRDDVDQLRSAEMITDQPVVAISGKGGCGKTYVVTKVIMAAKNTRTSNKTGSAEGDNREVTGDEETQCIGDEPEWLNTETRDINLLLTAPTGKAANLLGKRAGMASYTLHQIIFSYRKLPEGSEWKHADVNVLVVDECSLVSVSTFSFLVELLCEHAKLRRIILLGDIRQLPSIEPGNFLEDVFQSLTRIGCGIELRTNHRAESQVIVDNATRLAKKMYPIFDNEKFILRPLPESKPWETGNDYTAQDVNDEVVRLLRHPALEDHVNSQFISFTRRVCDSINDLCCKRYSDHRVKDKKKYVFQTGDKICCTRNGYVSVYEDRHGIMTCVLEDTARDANSSMDGSQGGVDRSINTDVDQGDNGLSRQPQTDAEAGAKGDQRKKETVAKINQIRLCNGEIFFIEEEVNRRSGNGKNETFFLLSDKDAQSEMKFWVKRRQIRQVCKIRHAWARTIHTFQGSEAENVVYLVGGRSRHQNWQHVYTAVTRGRKTVFIVGQDSVLREAIKRSEIKRQTSLRKQLIENFQKILHIKSSQKVPAPCTRTSTTAQDQSTVHNNTGMDTDILASLAAEHDDDEDMMDDSEDSPSLLADVHPPHNTARPPLSHTPVISMDRSEEPVAGPSNVPVCAEGITYPHAICSEPNTDEGTDVEIDDDDTDTDDSQSLLTTNVKPNVRENRLDEDKQIEEYSSDTDVDSDDSQSLLSDTPVRQKVCQLRVGNRQVSMDNKRTDSSVEARTWPVINKKTSATSQSDVWGTKLKTETSLSGTAGGKTKVRKQYTSTSFTKGICESTPAHPVSSRLHAGVSPITPAHVHANRLCTSILTPGIDSDRVDPHHNVQKTSSPFLQGNSCHISSGLSPLIPGFKDSFSVGLHDQRSLPTLRSSFTNGSNTLVSPQQCNSSTSLGTNAQGPPSNESQWSETDEDDYFKIDDGSKILQSAGASNRLHAGHCLDHSVTRSDHGSFTVIKDKQRQPIHLQTRLSNRLSVSDTCSRNVSTESQWSEVDDDHYLTLDLDDIVAMTNNKDFVTNNNEFSAKDISDEQSTQRADDGMGSELESPGRKKLVPNTPPTPVVPDTPPQVKPGMKRSPIKRQHSDRDEYEAKRMFDQDLVTSVSPLKRSLAKLVFK